MTIFPFAEPLLVTVFPYSAGVDAAYETVTGAEGDVESMETLLAECEKLVDLHGPVALPFQPRITGYARVELISPHAARSESSALAAPSVKLPC